jgi:hypothetical protein
MPLCDITFWTDHLRQTLERYDEPLLRRVAAKLLKPRNQWPAEELIERSVATVGNAAAIDRRLKDLEPASLQLLALIGHSRQPRWRLGNLVELAIALGHGDGLEPVLALLEVALLYPELPAGLNRVKSFEHWLGKAGSAGLAAFAHPSVTARAIEASPEFPGCPGEVPAGKAAAVHEPDGLEWPLRLAVLWQQVAGAPLRRTQQGGFFKRDADRLTSDPLLNAPPADSRAELPHPGLLAVALAEPEGVLRDADGELRAGDLPASWADGLPAALASLWAALPAIDRGNPLDGWPGPAAGGGNPYPSAVLLALVLLSRLPGDAWADPAAIEQWIVARHPYWTGESVRPSRRRSWLPGFLLGFAYQLRLLQAAKGRDGGWVVRLSPFGRWLLGIQDEPPALPQFPQTLLVQPNLEVVAYRQGLTPGLVATLSRFATWKSFGAACTLQMQPESVYRALEMGLTFESIVQTLERHGMRAVPTALVDSLRTWSDKRERIAVYPSATLFEFPTADDLNEALARGLPATRLGERLAVAATENGVDYRHFRLTGTRDYRLPPEKCIEVGDDGVTLSIDLARSDLLVDTELQRFAERVEAANGRPHYRLTPASLTAGRDRGVTLRGLEEWFLQRTGQPLPPAARLLLLGDQIPPGALKETLVLHVAAPEVADGLMQWPATRALIQERLGPTALAVEPDHADELRRRLQGLGLTVKS